MSRPNRTDSIGGPLWFIQLWAYAYFPQLAPKPNPSVLSRTSCYAHLFALSTYEPDHIPTFEDWFILFSDKERVRPAPHFLPFAEEKFTCPEMFLLSQEVNPLSSSLWAHVLQTRELVILQNKSSGVEVYSPHFLARQFGLLQSVPVPPIFTANDPWHQRSVCTNEEAEWEALMLSFNLPKTLKLTVWEVCPHCLAYEIIVEGKEKEVLEGEALTQTKTSSCTQVFKRRSKGIVIKDSAVEKDLASALAKANQVIASQRQEITALSIKAHQDVVSIITKEIPMHLSSPEKKQKLAAEKERLTSCT
uniref:Uncharacterized protein n=1 Tax=Fagus sylvatica TaxID=28930 RepID=A0A2N9HYF6_FAGSY